MIASTTNNIDQFIFADETGVDNRSANAVYGYSLKGRRSHSSRTFLRGSRYNLIAAVDCDGLLVSHVLEGTVTADTFYEFFVNRLLPHTNPFPGPRSIIVLDNASFHRRHDLYPLCDALGVVLVFLPPYSPDCNPIELSFRTLKAFIRRKRTEFRLNPLLTLFDGIDHLSYDHTRHFAECGYTNTLFATY